MPSKRPQAPRVRAVRESSDQAGRDDKPNEIAAGRSGQGARARGSLRVDRRDKAHHEVGDDAQGAEPGAQDEAGEQHEQHLQGQRHRAEHRHGNERPDRDQRGEQSREREIMGGEGRGQLSTHVYTES